jgi:hypothetical protein
LKKPFAFLFLWVVLFLLPPISFAASTLQYSWNMDTNPGWTTQGLWAWGVPQGLGGGLYQGGPDPNSGHIGTNVYGYNLSGNYEPNLLTARYLTTQPINCTGLSQVTLKFWLWLGVEKYDPPFGDHADIEVSNDGSNWTTIANNLGVQWEDTSWHLMQFSGANFSIYADNQPTVYIRWAMGPTDSSLNFCGFNIDDVEIWAEAAVTSPAATTGSATSVSSSSATLNGTVNPNGASTGVVFNYGLSTGYGSTATASQSPLSAGTSAQAVSATVSGLTNGKTYHYRVAATNSAGTTYGSDRTFSTVTSCPPCSGTVVIVENVTFPSNKNCECTASTSITMGTGITFGTGANVTFMAPKVSLKPGFHVPPTARINIRQP